MKEEELEMMFNNLKGSWDTAEPAEGHQVRFLERLSADNGTVVMRTRQHGWIKSLAIAACLAVVCVTAIFLVQQEPTVDTQVAQIAPEASQTQLYFSSLIEEQVKRIEAANTPATTTLVADTMSQLRNLEADYRRLEQDLINGGNSNLIMQAMIANFQTRIDLLQEVMNTINTINNINTTNDENFTI